MGPTENEETIVTYQSDSKFPIVTHGLSFEEACVRHIGPTLGCSRSFILASGTLSRETAALARLEQALGGSVVGVRKGLQSHTFLTEVLELVAQVETAKADCLVTLGGGSLVDAAKIVSFVCLHPASSRDDSRHVLM